MTGSQQPMVAVPAWQLTSTARSADGRQTKTERSPHE